MNILILNWRGPKHPTAGGAEQVTLEHAKAWVRAGHNVTWFTSYFRGAKKVETISRVKIVRAGRQFIDVQFRAFLWYLFGTHPKFDLVVDQFHGIPFFTPLYVRTKKLAFIHEVTKEVWGLNQWPKPFNFIPSLFGGLGEPFIFNLFYRKTPFLTVSKSTKEDLIAWGIPDKNIAVIHNGVNLILPEPLPPKEKRKTAMFLGALTADKGVEDVIKVFAEINKHNENWQFWLAGKASREYGEIMTNLADKMGLGKRFKNWGYVSEEKKFELLARSHVLVNPSIREGWCLVNIEANSVGVPVFGYKVAGMVDSVKKGTGFLVTPGDICELADRTRGVVNDKIKLAKMQKNAKAWASKFSWEKSGKDSLKLIEKLTSISS